MARTERYKLHDREAVAEMPDWLKEKQCPHKKKYMAGKRNVKAPRGRVLVGKEAVSGAPLRVQARVLNDSAKPYDLTAPAPKFTIIQEPAGGGDHRGAHGPLVRALLLGNHAARRLGPDGVALLPLGPARSLHGGFRLDGACPQPPSQIVPADGARPLGGAFDIGPFER